MAMSLFDKARIAVLSHAHGLLDKQVNTPEGYEQLIRDLEGGLADFHSAIDEATGRVNGMKRDIAALVAKQGQLQADIDQLITDNDPTNDDAALQLQGQLGELTTDLTTRQQELTDAQAECEQLNQSADQLETKHRNMVHELSQLKSLQATTKAKNRAASAAESAEAASDAAEGASVDSIRANLQHENDTVSARYDRVIGALKDTGASPERVAAMSRDKAALEARRAELAAKAAGQVQTPEAAPTTS
ncbi:MAG: PspA/IM30 family protein [Candidatus Saccharibacteria bacterium]|nr:PspA/IM30 family protein [Candidatus Saccharibacteria bacterium]